MFERAGIPVLYTGIGKVNAAYGLTRRLSQYAARRRTHAASDQLLARRAVAGIAPVRCWNVTPSSSVTWM